MPSMELSQIRICGQLYQNIFDQFFQINFNINYVPMIRKTIFRLCQINTNHRYVFSVGDKKSTVKEPVQTETPKQQESETTKKELKEKQYGQGDEEQVPLAKQNRNTLGWWIYRFFFWGGMSLLTYNVYLAYTHNKKTPVEQEKGAVPIFIDAAKAIVHSINEMTEFVTQPPSKKLLPDTVHPDFHPKTLVLNLTNTLVKSQYIFGKGLKYTLRPGLENMLRKLVTKYEIIIFAEQDCNFVMNSLNHVDPRHQYIQGFLGKESMVWRGGHYIKDLKYLNRDLRKIVVVDHKLQNVKNHPQNVILLSDFNGDKEDIELSKLLVLLDNLAAPEIGDVRKYLQTLGDNPVENFYTRIKSKQKTLQKKQKSGLFGLFNGNPKSANKPTADL